MEENMIYVLIFPTILNTILLIVMAFVLYKLLVIAGDLSFRIGKFVDRGEEEIFSTNTSIRNAADQAAGLLGKMTQVIDKYAFAESLNKGEIGNKRIGQILSGIGVGFSVYKFISGLFKKDKK